MCYEGQIVSFKTSFKRVYKVLKYFTYSISRNTRIVSAQLCIACLQPEYMFVTEQGQ